MGRPEAIRDIPAEAPEQDMSVQFEHKHQGRFRLAAVGAVFAAVVAGRSCTAIVAAEGPIPPSSKAPRGSREFYPSPERPVGWRGDGSGRFPGATPPTTWSRRLKDITSEVVVQAARPEQQPGPDSHTLAYFTVKDWLLAGPFPAPDPEQDIDRDFLGGESEIQPDAGAPAGNRQWKVHRAYEGSQSYRNHNENTNTHLYVDFVHAFGRLVPPEEPARYARYSDLDKRAAYAHTYLHAPRESDVYVDMIHRLPAVRMWVNGKPHRVEKGTTRRPATIKVHLQKGWNRLLVKAICDKAQMPWRNKYASPKDVQGQTQWRFSIYIRPAGPGPFSYETESIEWMTKLTGRNASQPIVVGNRLFVGSGGTDLVCLDTDSGKILWMHTVTYWDAMPDEARAAVKDEAAPLMGQLDKANKEMISLLNENISPQGLDTGRQAAIDEKLDERNQLARSVHRSLSTGRRGRLYDNKLSAGNATPTSDGKLVYWVVQGEGGYVTAAFDLDGEQVWSDFVFHGHIPHHGSHRSPVLCDGKLFVSTSELLIAYDAATGRELWRTPYSEPLYSTRGQPIVVQVEGRRALQTIDRLVSLDGKVLSENGYDIWGVYVPVVENGVLYSSCNRRRQYEFEAMEIPIDPRAIGEQQGANWKLDARTLYGSLVDTTLFFYVASPLYVDGFVYQVDMTGIMVAIDTRKRKRAYLRWMDGYNYNARNLYGYCASPALAGEYIYLLDGVGYTTILKPGPEGTVVGNNMLQNLSNQRGSAPCNQEGFYAGMFFHGKRVFVHSDNYLYCIRKDEKNPAAAAARATGGESGGRPGGSRGSHGAKKLRGQARRPAGEGIGDSAGPPQAAPKVPHGPGPGVHSRTFRGSGYGSYPRARIPLEWSSASRPRWKVEIGGGYGSPVVSGRRVFVTAEPDRLHCVDLREGRILWTRTNGFDQLPAEQAGRARKQPTDCGYATPTPYTDGRHVWAVYGTGVVSCFDMEGRRRWIRYIDHKQVNEYGRSASPVMAGGKLIVTVTHLVALDPQTGRIAWEQPRVREAYGTPAVTRIGGHDVLVTPGGYLVAADDGRVLAGEMGTAANASPVVRAGVAYFCDADATAWKLPDSLEAKPGELWYTELDGEFFASPVLHGGILYCMANDGCLYAVNAADGEILCEEDLLGGDVPMGEITGIYPSLVLAGGHLLVTSNDGQTAVIKPGPKLAVLRVNKCVPGSGATPVIDGNRLLIRSGSRLVSF